MPEQDTPKPKSKRTTIADLKKDLQEVEKVIGEDILEKLVDHEVRLEKIETGSLSNREDVAADIAARLSALEEGMTILQGNQSTLMKQYIEQQKRLDEEKPDGAVTNVTDRLTALEDATGALADAVREIAAGVADWGTRMEDAEDSIRSLIGRREYTQESATHTGPVPLPRPIPEAGKRVDLAALKAIAQVAQTMSDVLHMTRALKASSELNDQERREIISIACIAADVPYADNLLARAGVRSFEA
ncbi:MAG: hypothetical protein GWP10_05640 [Nitrospiraceae bacterium]|nr:hypothetical protein [Nitrospiraceae bacterium]